MQKGKIVLFLLAIGLATVFTGCKYEDGPLVSFRSKTERISNVWKVESAVEEDGDDVTADWENTEITLRDDNTVRWEESGVGISGTWELVNEDADLKISFTVLGITSSTTYTILKLAEKKLWLMDKDGQRTEIHLIPVA